MQVGLKYKKNWCTFSKKIRVGYSLGYSSATRVYKFRFTGITQMQYIIHKYPIGQQIKMLEKGRMLRKDTVANYSFTAKIYLFKDNNRNNKKRCEICS